MGTKGVGEWADYSINVNKGCSHNCLYCYAKWMAFKYKRITNPEEWKVMKTNKKAVNKGYRKRKGRGMFPTTHDITEENVSNCLIVLKKLLESGNNILITTKPHSKIIKFLMFNLMKYKQQLQYRFTITTRFDITQQYWEPNAPSITQRIRSLKLAFDNGWKTSVSIEPYLDENPIPLINEVAEYTTESIWLGIMNLKFTHFFKDKIPEGFLERYSMENLQRIVSDINQLHSSTRDLVRLKDSISNMGFLIGEKLKRKEMEWYQKTIDERYPQ